MSISVPVLTRILLSVCLLLSGSVYAAKYKIGIAQFGPHPQLDMTVDSFKKQIAAEGFTDVEYEFNHVNFDTALMPQLLEKLKAGKPDLILTVTTPMSQGAKNILKGSKIPVVFAAVTDPVAAKLTPSWDKGDTYMTGASDLQNIDAILGFTHRLLPNAKRLAVPYNPGEANDVAALELIKSLAGKHGFTVVEAGIDNANDIPVRIRALKDKADVAYISTSNLLQPALPAVAAAANAIKLPIVNSVAEPVSEHQVLAAYAVDYAQVGGNAAKLAGKILQGTAPASLAPMRPEDVDHKPVISAKQLQYLGLSLPAEFNDCHCVVE